MLNRLIGIVCIALMLLGNSFLFVRDVLPDLLAGDPPTVQSHVPEDEEIRSQIGIQDDTGRIVGRSWTVVTGHEEYVDINSVTVLNPVALPQRLSTPALQIDTDLRYRSEDALLDELIMRVHGLPHSIELHGEFFPPDMFVCRWRLGTLRNGRFTLDAAATRATGEALRPFARLPGLYVGRSWRLQLLNPLTQAIPGLREQGLLDEAVIVRVTRVEEIEHRGRVVETHVVEAPRVRAWVASDGTVLRQQVDMPLLGTLLLIDEPFDEDAYREIQRRAGLFNGTREVGGNG